MNTVSATITLAVIAIVMLGATISGQFSVEAKSKETSNVSQEKSKIKANSTEPSKEQGSNVQSNLAGTANSFLLVDQFSSSGDQSVKSSQANTLQATAQTSNPLLDKEEFDITVTNIKHENITVAVTVDGLKNSTIVPGNPPNVITPTSKVIVFRFDRHEHASTPAVLPIKLGDQYTACISFTSNKGETSCLAASIDSITQPQKKSLDGNYIPF